MLKFHKNNREEMFWWLQDREGLIKTQIALIIKENIDELNNAEIKNSVQQRIHYRLKKKKKQAKTLRCLQHIKWQKISTGDK